MSTLVLTKTDRSARSSEIASAPFRKKVQQSLPQHSFISGDDQIAVGIQNQLDLEFRNKVPIRLQHSSSNSLIETSSSCNGCGRAKFRKRSPLLKDYVPHSATMTLLLLLSIEFEALQKLDVTLQRGNRVLELMSQARRHLAETLEVVL